MNNSVGARLVLAVLLLLLGAAVGVSTVLLHALWWGLALGLAATAATLVAVPGGWWRRLPFALGWVAAVAVLARETPEGDYLISSNLRGYAVLGAAVVVLLVGVVSVRPGGTPRREDSGPDTQPS